MVTGAAGVDTATSGVAVAVTVIVTVTALVSAIAPAEFWLAMKTNEELTFAPEESPEQPGAAAKTKATPVAALPLVSVWFDGVTRSPVGSVPGLTTTGKVVSVPGFTVIVTGVAGPVAVLHVIVLAVVELKDNPAACSR